VLSAVRSAVQDRPRVALVAHGIHDDGGMQRAFAELVRRLHGRYEFVVVSGDLGNDLRGLVAWRRVPVPQRPAPLRFALFYVIAGLRLATTRADVVHTLGAIVPNRAHLASVHFCNAGFVEAVGLAPPAAPLPRRINTGLARVLGLLAERWSYRRGRLDFLAPVSAGVARELERHFGGVPIRMTPNGIDRMRFRPDADVRVEVRRDLNIAADEVVSLFVGGDWHAKGLRLAVEGLAEASREVPLRLVVVGRGDEAHFRRLASRLGVAERVTFVGERRDTERFYAAADIFVLPTVYETFSLAAFEAAASGLPVVAPRVSGIEDLVGDDAAGVIVRRDANEIGAALARLAASAELRSVLGAAARERSAAFTWDRSIAAVASVYRSVTEADGLAPAGARA
jgi:glycosyltransferase involved in cell wall biosynthesis